MGTNRMQKLMEEKEQLDARIRKLDAFISSGLAVVTSEGEAFLELPSPQQHLLIQQLLVMRRYSDILTLRIES